MLTKEKIQAAMIRRINEERIPYRRYEDFLLAVVDIVVDTVAEVLVTCDKSCDKSGQSEPTCDNPE
ncbi:MAG: hypothetical protein ACWGQW_00250 [bacterium]